MTLIYSQQRCCWQGRLAADRLVVSQARGCGRPASEG